jgi:hypothetical protein
MSHGIVLAAFLGVAGCADGPETSQDGSSTIERALAAATRLRMAPLVDMQLSEVSLSQLAAASGITTSGLTYIVASGGVCPASWLDGSDPRQGVFRDQMDALRARGGEVKVSLGGPIGIDLADACPTEQSLAAEYQAVVDAYRLRFVDFDVERNGGLDPRSTARRSKALAILKRANRGLKISLSVAVGSNGLEFDGQNVVTSARDAGVTIDLFDILAMDFFEPGADYGDLAIQAARATAAQLRRLFPGLSDRQALARLGVTAMIGENDDGGVFNQADARDLVAFARSKRLGFLSFWEANRDRRACFGSLGA